MSVHVSIKSLAKIKASQIVFSSLIKWITINYKKPPKKEINTINTYNFVVSNPKESAKHIIVKKDEKQINKELKQIEKWYEIQESLAVHFNSLYSWTIDREHIFEGLYLLLVDKYKLEWPGDLWDVHIEYEEALKLLSEFDFNIILNKIETDVEIFPKDFLVQYKVRIKSKGLIWIIHKNDIDPFPSNPHAHQLDNNIKLDLSNGKCYKRKKYMYTITKKHLLKIRETAANRIENDLPSLMI